MRERKRSSVQSAMHCFPKTLMWNNMFSQFMRGRNPLNALYAILAFHQNSIWIDTLLQFMKERNNWHSNALNVILIFWKKERWKNVSSVHERKKPFKCSLCDSSFSSKQHMNRHITSVHEGKKQLTFKCSECDSSFSKKGEMKKCFLSSWEEETL